MAYVPLTSGKIDSTDIPLILAGPILRKVTADSVSVWVATKKRCTKVQLSVYDNTSGTQIGSEVTAATRQIGDYLHICVVTATSLTLAPETIYRYQLKCDCNDGSGANDLHAAGILTKAGGEASKKLISYSSFESGGLPTFILPPPRWGDVRLLHASCRMFHSPGFDSLAAIDDIVGLSCDQTKTQIPKHLVRPHLLVMSGDQIYDDDVSPVFLRMLRDIGKVVVSGAAGTKYADTYWKAFEDTPTVFGGKNLWPMLPHRRASLARSIAGGLIADHLPHQRPALNKLPDPLRNKTCNFTTKRAEARNHLFTFEEFCAMYLMSWSAVLWPSLVVADNATYQDLDTKLAEVFPDAKTTFGLKTLPDADEWPLKAQAGSDEKHLTQGYEATQLRPLGQMIRRHNLDLSALEHARRAMANIATYMIFDDHEFADDAFFTVNWCARVLGGDSGRRVIQNALKTFAVFQAWGNTPERFTGTEPGAKLLGKLELGNTHPHSAEDDALNALLAIPKQTALFSPDIWNGTLTGDQVLSKLDLSAAMTSQLSAIKAAGGVTLVRGAAGSFVPWYFTLELGNYQIVVPDNRTYRAFPGWLDEGTSTTDNHGFAPCIPISDAVLEQMVPKLPAASPVEMTFVVSQLPLFDIPVLHFIRETGLALAQSDLSVFRKIGYALENAVDLEGWDSYRKPYQKFLSHLAARKAGTDKTRVVVLSGDIHHSFAVRYRYWATRPASESGLRNLDSIFACFTASACKKNDKLTKMLHGRYLNNNGYEALGGLANRREHRLFCGWGTSPAPPGLALGEVELGGATPVKWTIPGMSDPAVLDLEEWLRWISAPPAGTTSVKLTLPVPDWTYRIDYLDGTVRSQVLPITVEPPAVAAIDNFAKALREHQRALFNYGAATGPGKQLVGLHNVGDVYFDYYDLAGKPTTAGAPGARLQAVQAVWWSRIYDRKTDNAVEAVKVPRWEPRTIFLCDFEFTDHPQYVPVTKYLSDPTSYVGLP